MIMATLTTALNSAFTPGVGDFIAQTTGPVVLERRNTTGAAWVAAASMERGSYIVANPVDGAQYRFVPVGSPNASVQADQ